MSDAIAALRAELVAAMAEGQTEVLRFELGPLELEFTVDFRMDGVADAGIRWGVAAREGRLVTGEAGPPA